MSRTDKTDPYWVKILRKDSPEVSEYHDHRYGFCDISEATGKEVFWWKAGRACGYDLSYGGRNNKFYGRGPTNWLKSEVRMREGGKRAQFRKDAREMLKLDSEGIEDYDVINPRHRHSVLWDY